MFSLHHLTWSRWFPFFLLYVRQNHLSLFHSVKNDVDFHKKKMSRQVRPRLCLSPLVSLKKRKRAVFKHLKEKIKQPTRKRLELRDRSTLCTCSPSNSRLKEKRERERERERERGRERGGALPKDISKSELSFFSFLSVSSSYLFLRIFWSPLSVIDSDF